jgi:hypothetical protein
LLKARPGFIVGDGPAVRDSAVAILPVSPSTGGLRAVFAVICDDVSVVAEAIKVDDGITCAYG